MRWEDGSPHFDDQEMRNDEYARIRDSVTAGTERAVIDAARERAAIAKHDAERSKAAGEKSAEARKAKSPTTIYATEALEFLRARRQANPKDSSGNIAEGMKDKFKGSVSMWWRYIADAEAEGLVPEQK